MGCSHSDTRGSSQPPTAGAEQQGSAKQPSLADSAKSKKAPPTPTQPPSSTTTQATVGRAAERKTSEEQGNTTSTVRAPPGKAQPAPPPLPPVPSSSWYATPFELSPHVPITNFHFRNKGKVVFATRQVPVTAAELDALPDHGPEVCTELELGKDLLYGMAYLHNTALFTEHHWRRRVVHLRCFREGKLRLPPSLRLTSMRRPQHRGSAPAAPAAATTSSDSAAAVGATRAPEGGTSVSSNGEATTGPGHDKTPEDDSLANVHSNTRPTHSSEEASSVVRSMKRGEETLLARPSSDTLLGIKVFVNDELVPDHYPTPTSLPQCTATLQCSEAVSSWVCVPFVLVGYLNQAMLDPIVLYRALSLSFVEHILHLKLGDGSAAASQKTGTPPRSLLRLRVEVVYGCRAEAYFCSDFIARGACTLRVTPRTKPALKAYEESLRGLIKAKRAAGQIIRADLGDKSTRPRPCPTCGNPLLYVCTLCGALCCGRLCCAHERLDGYPRGCSTHQADEALL